MNKISTIVGPSQKCKSKFLKRISCRQLRHATELYFTTEYNYDGHYTLKSSLISRLEKEMLSN